MSEDHTLCKLHAHSLTWRCVRADARSAKARDVHILCDRNRCTLQQIIPYIRADIMHMVCHSAAAAVVFSSTVSESESGIN